ncbi:hypothetical protein PLICRDRAFT_259032 [Plicaturopsis crispa FD-325 SS-3]|nr:hypothetical protein PLICRDRAFT_259032 [Plicaturopsis crispa FD-325 SS-3]
MSAMPNTSSPFEGLPDELVLRIFTLAAASSFEACLALTLVAGWTRPIVLPYLLQTVVIRSEAAAESFIDLLVQNPHHAPLVKAASFAFAGDDRDGLCYGIVKRCQNLINVAMLPATFHDFAYWGGTLFPPSRELHITVPAPPGGDADGNFNFTNALASIIVRQRYGGPPVPVVEHITRVDATILTGWSGRANPFGAFEHLTHVRVAFHSGPRGDMYNAVTVTLEKHANIQVLVFSVDDTHYRDDVVLAEWFWRTRDRMDGRLYVTGAQNTLEEWERAARGGSSIWDDAIRETEEWWLSRA